MKRNTLPLLLVFAASLYGGTFYPAKPGEAVVPNQYLVRMVPGASPAQIVSGIVPGANVQPLPSLNPQLSVHKVTLPAGSTAADAGRLANSSFVIYVEPNRIRKVVLAAPNDPSFSQQYGLAVTQANQAWGLLPNGYLTSSTAGSGRVTVAVIDTGIDCTHPDFMNAGGSSTDSALGGQLAFSLSKAYAATTVPSPKCSWQDDFGHGTHVAGIVAAATNNSTGVAGLGFPLQVAGYKGLDSSGSGDDATLSTAIMDAANAGIPIVSASWGAAGYSQTLQQAVDYAWQRNTMFIAAAGNDHSNELFYPAGATHAFGVAATDSANAPASFSNFGNDVSIAAPGVGILSTMPTYANPMNATNYQNLSGTSMATPFVSALAGLLAMSTPNASAAAILQRIQQTASSTTANGGWDPTKGYGVINAYSALSDTVRTATSGSLVGQVTDATGVPVSGAVVTVSGQAPVTADANGLYRVTAVPAGTFAVSVTGGSSPAQNLSATIAPGADTVLPITMGISYGKFTGTVTDAGAAVGGVIVQAISQTVNGALISATTVSDLNGSYTLWVAPGTYDVKASTLAADSGTVAAKTVAAGGSTAVNLAIARFGTIAGTVRSGTQGLNGAQLKITGGGMTFGAVSDVNGNYKTIGLPKGTYTIDAAYGSSTDVIVNSVAVTDDTTTTENIQFQTAPPTATVQFVTTDTTTQGNWKPKYGADGYTIVGNATLNPSYAAPSSNGSQYVWAPSTSDVRALQKVGTTDRIAATWYSLTNFIIDLNFSDAATHQVAIYCDDWDSFGPRIQTIDVLDSNGNVLDTRTLSNFAGGEYLVWNISGHAKIRATTVQGNAVIEGLFFGGAPVVLPPTATVQFLSTDTATQGNWKSKYGADGYTVVGNAVLNPAYAAPSTAAPQYVWAASTTDVRALQKVGSSDRIAATWYSTTSFSIDLNFSDAATHQVAVYCEDWDNFGPRIQTIDVVDSNNNVLDTHTLSNFNGGQYLVWNISGHAKIRATTVQGDAVIEGIFFGGAPSTTPAATVKFVTTDTTTQGTWKSKYGSEGYTVVASGALNPSYVTPVSTGSQYVWAASTTDVRALQKANASDRIAATWYSNTSFTIDLNFTDQVSHQVAIYCDDWDNFGPRIQTIDVIDTNNNVLDTHTLSNFGGGQYLVWNITGHVQIRATAMQGNAVIEGIFFGGAPAAPNGHAQYVTTDLATQGNWKTKYGLDGYSVAGDSTLNPAYVTPVSSGSVYVWNGSTTDVRALQKASAPDRIAATWFSTTSFAIDLNITDANTHQVAVYCMDWDSFGPRIQTVDVLDSNDNVLDTRNVSGFSAGEYLVWNVSGHVKIRATTVQGNAVIEGIFFR